MRSKLHAAEKFDLRISSRIFVNEMQNQPPPIVNQGEMPPNYGQPPGPGPHPGMGPMGGGMPYPPYMMFPMGAPFMYMPQHPDIQGHPSQEMMMDPHFRNQMMPMPYPMPHHPMSMHGMPPHMQMNPNVAQFVPHRRDSAPAVAPAVAPAAVPVPKTPSETVGAAVPKPVSTPPSEKPVSRRLAIIDPATGQEISFKPVPITQSPPPASALTPAVVALRDPKAPPLKTPSPVSPEMVASTLVVPTPPLSPKPAAPESPPAVSGKLRLKNAPLPKKPVVVVPVSVALPGLKLLKGIKNAPLVRKSTDTPPLVAPSKGGSKLINKPIRPAAKAPEMWPIPRAVFLQYMPLSKPDRYAPSHSNVFPSELLGLRTCVHGDPGLALRGRRANVSLQKTTSSVSTGSGGGVWRNNSRVGGGRLGRQSSSSSKKGPLLIVRPSERGFKILDQSSLSEKEKLRRQTMSLLNKITVDSFKAITAKISEIEITQPWQMDVVIGLIFDKAVVEHSYSEMYADMCRTLRNQWPELEGVDQETGQSVPVTFSRAIIEKCQVEFDAIPETLELTEAEIARAKGDPQDLEIFMHKKKERILGNMKFIAQLFLMRILSSRVVRSVVEQLLFRTDEPEEHYIECVSILLHNIGATLYETESGRAYIAQFADRMNDLTTREAYGKRIKFLMSDLVDAASLGWAGKHSRHVAAAKSKEEVRKDAIDEQKRKSTPAPPRGYQKPAPVVQNYTSVLKRADPPVQRRDSIPEDWTDEEDDVSEYAPEDEKSEEEEEFTQVKARK